MTEKKYLAEMEGLFTALSDKTRLRILNLMRENEICVYYFTEVLGESQPKISRHLAYLRNAGIVSARREGKLMYYKIETPENACARKIMQNVLEWLEMQEHPREDYNKLTRIADFAAESFPPPRKEEISAKAYIRTNEGEELATFLL